MPHESAHDRIGEDRPGLSSPAPLLSDLTAQLLFPRIFRAGAAAARPDRVLVAMISIVPVVIAGLLLGGDPARPALLQRLVVLLGLAFDGVGSSILRLDMPDLHERVRFALLEIPRQLFQDAGWLGLFAVLVLAAAWAWGGAYITRAAALELGRYLRLRPASSMRFALRRGATALATVLFIPLVVLVLLAVPAMLGLLLAAPGLDVVGSVLYGVGLLTSLLAGALLVVWIGAFWMLVPAVACDGADAFDAVQRAMGLVLNRPISVGLHLALAIVQGLVLVGLVWTVADLGTAMAGWAAGLFSERAAAIVGAGGMATADTPAMEGLSIAIVGLWRGLPVFAAAAYAVSYTHTAGVAVYLNARQMVDGQEPNEIWMPGDPPGITTPDRVNPPGTTAGTTSGGVGPSENPEAGCESSPNR